MNWEMIQENYPKAFLEFIGEDGNERIICGDLEPVSYIAGDPFHLRDLYEFFEGEKLHVDIFKEVMGSVSDFYMWEIHEPHPEGGYHSIAFSSTAERIKTNDFPKSRTDAEEEAFIKAFEILEEILESRF